MLRIAVLFLALIAALAILAIAVIAATAATPHIIQVERCIKTPLLRFSRNTNVNANDYQSSISVHEGGG